MAKPQKQKKIELTIRTADQVLIDRLEWAEYNRKDLSTRNAALLEAIGGWLDRMEQQFGKPPARKPSIVGAKSKAG